MKNKWCGSENERKLLKLNVGRWKIICGREAFSWVKAEKERLKQNCSIYTRELQPWSRSNLPLMSLLPKTVVNFWRRNYKQESKFSELKVWILGRKSSLIFQSSRSAFACSRASAALMSSFNHCFIYCWFVERAYYNLRNEKKLNLWFAKETRNL